MWRTSPEDPASRVPARFGTHWSLPSSSPSDTLGNGVLAFSSPALSTPCHVSSFPMSNKSLAAQLAPVAPRWSPKRSCNFLPCSCCISVTPPRAPRWSPHRSLGLLLFSCGFWLVPPAAPGRSPLDSSGRPTLFLLLRPGACPSVGHHNMRAMPQPMPASRRKDNGDGVCSQHPADPMRDITCSMQQSLCVIPCAHSHKPCAVSSAPYSQRPGDRGCPQVPARRWPTFQVYRCHRHPWGGPFTSPSSYCTAAPSLSRTPSQVRPQTGPTLHTPCTSPFLYHSTASTKLTVLILHR